MQKVLLKVTAMNQRNFMLFHVFNLHLHNLKIEDKVIFSINKENPNMIK